MDQVAILDWVFTKLGYYFYAAHTAVGSGSTLAPDNLAKNVRFLAVFFCCTPSSGRLRADVMTVSFDPKRTIEPGLAYDRPLSALLWSTDEAQRRDEGRKG